MKKIIGHTILFLLGWKTEFLPELKIKKMVVVGAPYTSRMDILISICGYWKEGVNARMLVDKRATKGLIGSFVKWIGGIGIDKKEGETIVEFSANLFKENKELLLVVTPEGTRERVDKWKTGFYRIARLADVPLCLSTMDYRTKTAHIFEVYNVTGDFEKCMSYIEKHYSKVTPRHPEKYNKKIF